MKKWAVLTVLLYAIVLLLLIVPGILIAFAGKGHVVSQGVGSFQRLVLLDFFRGFGCRAGIVAAVAH
jgi:hypothetical protein